MASIFVNPTRSDRGRGRLATYPRDPDSDRRKCEECHNGQRSSCPSHARSTLMAFRPSSRWRKYQSPCAGRRDRGISEESATVVTKLFNIVMPHKAYFGKKDFQRFRVISTVVRDLDMNLSIIPCDTVREADGLAMSSRNARLTRDQRSRAVCLYEALVEAKETLQNRGERAGNISHS